MEEACNLREKNKLAQAAVFSFFMTWVTTSVTRTMATKPFSLAIRGTDSYTVDTKVSIAACVKLVTERKSPCKVWFTRKYTDSANVGKAVGCAEGLADEEEGDGVGA